MRLRGGGTEETGETKVIKEVAAKSALRSYDRTLWKGSYITIFSNKRVCISCPLTDFALPL